MNNYIFSSGNVFDQKQFNNIDIFIDIYPEFYDITLDNEAQFTSLFQLLGLNLPKPTYLNNEEFVYLIDLSSQLLPELTEEEFDLFYSKWLKNTGRNNTMDEYGQLIFLQGVSSKMNKDKYRFALCLSRRT